jgi:DNA-binding phage protein
VNCFQEIVDFRGLTRRVALDDVGHFQLAFFGFTFSLSSDEMIDGLQSGQFSNQSSAPALSLTRFGSTTMANHAFRSSDVETLLNTAFETNDLKRICRAIDAAVLQSGSIIEVARAAKVDRVTLYRAFRLANGPALDNMIKVLRVLGFELVVEAGTGVANNDASGAPTGVESTARKQAATTARRFTAALKSGDRELLVKVFKETLRAQENVAEFAGKTIRTRETLYRAFNQFTPKFSTLLSFLNALNLRFGVRRLP